MSKKEKFRSATGYPINKKASKVFPDGSGFLKSKIKTSSKKAFKPEKFNIKPVGKLKAALSDLVCVENLILPEYVAFLVSNFILGASHQMSIDSFDKPILEQAAARLINKCSKQFIKQQKKDFMHMVNMKPEKFAMIQKEVMDLLKKI